MEVPILRPRPEYPLAWCELTTLWYGISETYFDGSVQTIGMIIAVLLDLGIIGTGSRRRRVAA